MSTSEKWDRMMKPRRYYKDIPQKEYKGGARELLLQNARVCFSAPSLGGLLPPVALDPADLMASPWPPRTLA